MSNTYKKGIALAIAYVIFKWAFVGLIGTYLYKQGLWSNWYLLVPPVIVLFVYLLTKQRYPFKKFFKNRIEKQFENDEAKSLLADVENRFVKLAVDTKFATKSSNPMDRRLDFTAYFLALIQALEVRGFTYEQIKTLCLEITYDYVAPKNPIHAELKKIPTQLMGMKVVQPLLRFFNKKISIKGDPDGFRAEVLTDKSTTFDLGFGIDIHECGICKFFQKHQAAQYVSILCEVDKVTSNMAGLELIRNGTIALGAEKCDFRYKRI